MPDSLRGTPFDATLAQMEKALGGEKREAELEAARDLGREALDVEAIANRLRYEGRT